MEKQPQNPEIQNSGIILKTFTHAFTDKLRGVNYVCCTIIKRDPSHVVIYYEIY